MGAVILYIIAFSIFNAVQKHQRNILFSSHYDILKESVTASILLKESTLNNVSSDYTVWDDMYRYFDSRDTDWSEENLATIIQSFKVNAVWAYNIKGEPIYHINNCYPDPSQFIPLPQEILSVLHNKRILNCYLHLPEGLFYLSGATVHPTIDLDRKSPPHGYLFIAKRLDGDYLKDLGLLTSSTVQLNKYSQKNDRSPTEVQYSFNLKDWKGSNADTLLFSRVFPYINEFFGFSKVSMVIFIGIAILVLLLFYFLFERWILKPLGHISGSLSKGETSSIDPLKTRKDEFGQIGSLLEDFITQKKELEKQVAEKNKAEKLLLESEEKFYKAFLFSPAAMMISSRDTRQILTVNEGFSKMTGMKLQDLIGFSVDSIGVFDDPGIFNDVANDLETGNSVKSHDIIFRTPVGEFCTGILKSDLVSIQGKSCLLSVIIDITQRKQMETAMNLAKEKAEESDRLKSFLLMNMSHELRTPLTGIMGFAEVIKDDSDEKNISLLADKILLSGNRLLATMNSFMTLAEIQSGNLKVLKKKCFLGKELKGLIKSYSRRAEEKSVQFTYTENEVEAIVDPELFRQIAERIMDNAVKFTHKGSITVTVKNSNSQGRNWADFSVADTGIGIPESKIDDIFVEFRQLSEGEGRSFEGSGLGLSIVKKLTLLLGGEILVKSQLNVGSTFTLRLPASPMN